MRALEWAVMAPERVERSSCWRAAHRPLPSRFALCSTQYRGHRGRRRRSAGRDYYDQIGGEGPVAAWAWPGGLGRSPTARMLSSPRASAQRPEGRGPGLWRPLRRRELSRARGRETGPALRPEQLRGALAGHEPPRCRAGPGRPRCRPRARAGRADGHRRRLGPPLPPRRAGRAGRTPADAPSVRVVNSIYGHDAFLVETDHVGKYLADALA